MTEEIEMLKSYAFFGTTLTGGARYRIGQMVSGHELSVDRARKLIEDGWAREVR